MQQPLTKLTPESRRHLDPARRRYLFRVALDPRLRDRLHAACRTLDVSMSRVIVRALDDLDDRVPLIDVPAFKYADRSRSMLTAYLTRRELKRFRAIDVGPEPPRYSGRPGYNDALRAHHLFRRWLGSRAFLGAVRVAVNAAYERGNWRGDRGLAGFRDCNVVRHALTLDPSIEETLR